MSAFGNSAHEGGSRAGLERGEIELGYSCQDSAVGMALLSCHTLRQGSQAARLPASIQSWTSDAPGKQAQLCPEAAPFN